MAKNQAFSYLYDKELPPGTLVSIPLFHRSVEGIVTGNRPDINWTGNINPVKSAEDGAEPFNRVKLKKINKVIEVNFLEEKQLKLAEFISEYYIYPLGIVLKSFVPKITSERKKKQEEKNEEFKNKKIRLTAEQLISIETITKNSKLKIKNSKFLLFGPAASGKTEVYIHSILALRKKHPDLQFLILLPELTLTPQAIERYGQYFKPEEIAVINSHLSKGKFFSEWQKIKSGEAKIIIGSRMAIFLPFKKLGLIVVDEEQDMSFKQWDMNPRYDARKVAEKLAEIYKCSLVLGSATPRTESFWKADNDNYKLTKIPRLSFVKNTDIELVDMKKERWIKNYSPISKKLESEIVYALKNKLQIILFINRQGMSNFSICANCREVFRCPDCDQALIYDEKGIYRCAHCVYKTSITPACKKCQGLVFNNIGLGTQKIEREIKLLFPKANVARIDTQSLKIPNYQEKIYSEFKAGQIDILIGTQMISKGWDLPRVSLIGIIDGDGMLSIPDFFTYEKAFGTLMQVSGRVSRPGAKFPGKVIIQTFNPQQEFFRNIQEKNIDKFYAKELKDRKELSLPPFSKLIKLIFQDKSLKKAESEINRVFNLLSIAPKSNLNVSDPQNSFISKIRVRFRKQIVIKILGQDISKELRATLHSLPSGWIIDVDPISIT